MEGMQMRIAQSEPIIFKSSSPPHPPTLKHHFDSIIENLPITK